MNVDRLARRMFELTSWLDSQEGDAVERHEFHAAPRGRVRITLDPRSTAPAASYNRNRIQLCGADGGLTQQGLDELVGMFAARNISRFFVWLNADPGIELVRAWLRPHSFEIRQVATEDFVAVRSVLFDVAIVSQTLTMLEDSLANLQRLGFREVYEQEVFEYSRR